MFDHLSEVIDDNAYFNITLTMSYFERRSHAIILFIENCKLVVCFILGNPKSNYVNNKMFQVLFASAVDDLLLIQE